MLADDTVFLTKVILEITLTVHEIHGQNYDVCCDV
jgi:hypothetical protein